MFAAATSPFPDPENRLKEYLKSVYDFNLRHPGSRAVLRARCFKMKHLCDQITVAKIGARAPFVTGMDEEPELSDRSELHLVSVLDHMGADPLYPGKGLGLYSNMRIIWWCAHWLEDLLRG